MKRRDLLIVLAALGGVAALKLRPGNRGAPHDAYFADLDALLKAQGPARPCLVLDLDRLDHNLAVFGRDLHPSKQWRVVAKSLPSIKLLDYVMRRHGTQRLMAFHQPFLNLQAQAFPASDLLLGKPMPVQAAAAFYQTHRGPFDPARQLQWLVDTPERVTEYRALARGLGTRLNLNIELDVGLHRGGVADDLTLLTLLEQIAEDPQHLRFSGFMGYDPHVVKLPGMLGSPEALQAASWARYRQALNVLAAQRPEWMTPALTFNGAGSPNYVLQTGESPLNEVGVGSALVQRWHDAGNTVIIAGRRMDALEQPVLPRFCHADEAHAVAERRRLGDVRGEHVADAADRHRRERRPRAERDARQDRQFVRRIYPVDIERRIGLGEAQRLRLGEHVGEIAAFRLHPTQDEVARAVQDASDAPDRIRRRALAQTLDDRDAARDRRFELERDASLLRRRAELQPVMRQHRLVRGDEALPRRQRRARKRQRRPVGTTDQLDHHVGVACGKLRRVVDPGKARQVDPAILAAIACRHRHDLDRPPRTPRDQRAVLLQQADHAATHRAQPRQRHLQRIRHVLRPLSLGLSA